MSRTTWGVVRKDLEETLKLNPELVEKHAAAVRAVQLLADTLDKMRSWDEPDVVARVPAAVKEYLAALASLGLTPKGALDLQKLKDAVAPAEKPARKLTGMRAAHTKRRGPLKAV